MLSILTLAVMIAYGAFKTKTLFEKQDYRVQTTELFDYYDEDETFGAEDGFMLAAGIIGLNGRIETDVQILDEIGRFRFVYTKFNQGDRLLPRQEIIPTRKCTKADFNINGTNEESRYYPLREKD